MSTVLGVGIIGCGNISSAYLGLSKMFQGIEVLACADMNMDAAHDDDPIAQVMADPMTLGSSILSHV